jgi:nitroreductase
MTEYTSSQAAPDTASLLNFFANRRSIKLGNIKPDALDRELVETVLEAANWAPSHGQTEPWQFTVYTGESRRALGAAFAEAYRIETESKGTFQTAAFEGYRDRVWNAPVWISLGMVPGMRPDGTPVMPEWEELIAAGSAVQNLHLAAAALGLGGKWTSNFTALHPHVAQFVGLEPPAKLIGFFFLGQPAIPWPKGSRRPITEKVRWAE